MKTCIKKFRIYGADGHRQRESFNDSYILDFSKGDNIRTIIVNNFDKTGTNEFTDLVITRNTAEECYEELWGQISDGIFENSRTGRVAELGEEINGQWYGTRKVQILT